MSDINGKSNKSVRERESSSRLSPLAEPFNFNTNTHVQEYNGQKSLNTLSLDLFNLDQPYNYGGCYVQSDPVLRHSDSIAMSSSSAEAAHHTVIGDHAWSMSYNSFPKQGDVDSCGDAAVIMEPYILLNANGKIVCHEKVPMGDRKEKKDGEHANNQAIDSLVVATSELPITSHDVPDAFSLETDGTELGICVHNSSVVLDQNDSDVDSPCWKGTGANQFPSGVAEPVGPQLPKIETEARKTLNPQAPHFFPKQLAEYDESECHGNDHLFFQVDPSLFAAFSSKEQRFIDSVKAGTYSSEVSNVMGTQCFNNIHDGGKKYSLPKKSGSCSVPNSLLGDEAFLLEDYLNSSGQGVTGANVTDSMKDINDTIHNGVSRVTSALTGNFRTSSCCTDGIPSVGEKHQGALKSTSPKLDVQSVISTMQDLSKFLLWKYSNDLDSINEHEHVMIQRIINNLYMCMTNEVQQRVSLPESGHHCTLDSPMKLSDCNKEMYF